MLLKKTLTLLGVFAPFLSLLAFNPGPSDSIESIDEDYVNWYNLDPKDDRRLGAAVDRAYLELLENKPSRKTITVAVIDAGVDIEHEDLRGKIWRNEGEIPDNGVDDDSNGYVDDVHGWNFIGNAEGENIDKANLELARIIGKYDTVFEAYSEASEVPDSLSDEYELYRRCLADYKDQYEPVKEIWNKVLKFRAFFFEQEAVVLNELGKDSGQVHQEDLGKIEPESEEVERAAAFFRMLYSNDFTYDALEKEYDHYHTRIARHLNPNFNPREIIGDDLTDMSEVHGNNEVKGPRCDHGTLVAGVIAANRGNQLGIDGIADDVKIMVLRTVPDGDEYDKDVAMSIIYAVQNGADVINMSFGKDYSPQKELVDSALSLAAKHDVLLVHAAGNDATNSDEITSYPADYYGIGDTLQAWLNVGANDRKKGRQMAAPFTNYGKSEVDLFAPGVNIVSTYPEDRYEVTNGTSFAGPVVSGVAALVWSRYPELTAVELKEVLMNSVTDKYDRKKVYLPTDEDDRDKVRFYELSRTGGIVNAYQALELAEEIAGDRKKKGELKEVSISPLNN